MLAASSVDESLAFLRLEEEKIVFKQNHDGNLKIFVGGLPKDLSEENFKIFFLNFGPISSSEIILDHKSNKSRCFGFVTFIFQDSVDQVLRENGFIKIEGKIVDCKSAV